MRIDKKLGPRTIFILCSFLPLFPLMAFFRSPGVWHFHCHRLEHNTEGMGVLFQVGTASQMPKPPRDFPRCGSWHFHGYDEDDESDDEKVEEGSQRNGTSNDVRCVITININRSGDFRFSVYLTIACLICFCW